jgi:caffeoyl-CoA O-methyltransferase
MAGLTLVNADVDAYLSAHTTRPDPLVTELTEQTRERFGYDARMLITPEQSTLFAMLAGLVGARTAVEVGTFTGLSALSFIRGMPADGRLVCLDISAEFTALAREFWAKAGVADRIDLRLGPAVKTLPALPADPHIDLAFIDADKTNYESYWAELVPRMRPGGLIIVDNALWSGRVLAPEPDDADSVALARFNAAVARDDRVESVMLAFADGLTLARRR